MARQRSAGRICQVLSRAGNRHLDQHGGNRSKDRHGNQAHNPATAFIVVTPPTATENNLDHFCLELEAVDPDELRAWLDSHGIDSGDFQVRYGAGGFGPSIYIRDPDGNTVELRISSASTA